ncbi:MAG TPA: Fe-S cluster assembly protein SufD [Devosiaceae bacterium]|nr:Fe-S cluster assembly protein SufD [Devosiaceae bacterium]
MNVPLRLGPAELKLVEQLTAAGARAEAERLAASGLPTRKVESYHYTDLKMLLRSVPDFAEAGAGIAASPLQLEGAWRLPIVNGQPREAAPPPPDVRLGQGEGPALSQRDDVLVRLNRALVPKCLTLTVDGHIHQLLHIDRQTAGPAGHATSAARILVSDGASVTIVETFSGNDAVHLGNHATYVAVGSGASVTHVTIDLSSRRATHFATNEYRLAENARLRTLVIHAGAGLSRTHLFPHFEGSGAYADLTGLNMVGEGQHADITMDASHAVPHTSSKPLFKSVARGRSRAVVQGRLVVARDAQKTDAKLMSQGLMLSDEAEILAKPELEIYADDVVCGHGATCGAIDDEALFYLMSRGVARADAETMLVRAFLAELLDPIENQSLQSALQGVIDHWLAGK